MTNHRREGNEMREKTMRTTLAEFDEILSEHRKEAHETAYKKGLEAGGFIASASLRDQFAMAALTGLLSSDLTLIANSDTARECYGIADVMLAARERTEADGK